MAIQLSRLDTLARGGRVPPAALAALRALLQSPDEAQLFRINALEFATRHGLPEREAIDALVRAAHAGLLDVSWTVVCPMCGFNIATARALHDMHAQGRCVSCEVDMEVALDDMVEISFSVSPAVRSLRYHQPEQLTSFEDLERVVASPSRILHPALKQAVMEGLLHFGVLQRGEERELEVTVARRSYRLISLSHHLASRVDVVGEPAASPQDLDVTFSSDGIRVSRDRLQPGVVRLHVRNVSEEYHAWSLAAKPVFTEAEVMGCYLTRFSPFLTGKRLLTSQAFRDLYRTETLPPGASLNLRSLTFLFTDLTGSTEMYDRIGDFSAYRLVREHFEILAAVVAEHDGAIVKTIGDAVMATFPEPGRALEATVQMHRRLDEWNRTHEADDLTLKVGIHEGPCIAVDSNDRLDYFGQTVNMAARIQGLAASRETYLSDTVRQTPTVAEVLRRHGLGLEGRLTHLKGIREDVMVYRATLA